MLYFIDTTDTQFFDMTFPQDCTRYHRVNIEIVKLGTILQNLLQMLLCSIRRVKKSSTCKILDETTRRSCVSNYG